MSNKTVDFYFDYGSLASWLAYTQLPKLVADTGATVAMKPMLLGGVFQSTGNRPPISVPAKGRYLFQDLDRFARRYGVPLVMNPHFPVNTITLMRADLGLQMRADPQLAVFRDAIFRAMWVEQQALGDPAVLAAVLTRAGFAPDAIADIAADPVVKEALKTCTQEAVDRGVFGAPTFFVGDQMFWGQDRIDFVREALAH
ncbi:MAG: 2-hydroxychromene-2-carboxylate isomerase [Rhodoferax sp.]|nr:2-hydroxychromene-2-carboxylate isomerase [Rhodoferax sp.]